MRVLEVSFDLEGVPAVGAPWTARGGVGVVETDGTRARQPFAPYEAYLDGALVQRGTTDAAGRWSATFTASTPGDHVLRVVANPGRPHQAEGVRVVRAYFAPEPPANLQGESPASLIVTLAWDAPVVTPDRPLDGYVLSREGVTVATLPANATSWIGGAPSARTYAFTLAAVNVAGKASSTVEITVLGDGGGGEGPGRYAAAIDDFEVCNSRGACSTVPRNGTIRVPSGPVSVATRFHGDVGTVEGGPVYHWINGTYTNGCGTGCFSTHRIGGDVPVGADGSFGTLFGWHNPRYDAYSGCGRVTISLWTGYHGRTGVDSASFTICS